MNVKTLKEEALNELKFCCMDFQRTGNEFDKGKVAGAQYVCRRIGINEDLIDTVTNSYPRPAHVTRG